MARRRKKKSLLGRELASATSALASQRTAAALPAPAVPIHPDVLNRPSVHRGGVNTGVTAPTAAPARPAGVVTRLATTRGANTPFPDVTEFVSSPSTPAEASAAIDRQRAALNQPVAPTGAPTAPGAPPVAPVAAPPVQAPLATNQERLRAFGTESVRANLPQQQQAPVRAADFFATPGVDANIGSLRAGSRAVNRQAFAAYDSQTREFNEGFSAMLAGHGNQPWQSVDEFVAAVQSVEGYAPFIHEHAKQLAQKFMPRNLVREQELTEFNKNFAAAEPGTFLMQPDGKTIQKPVPEPVEPVEFKDKPTSEQLSLRAQVELENPGFTLNNAGKFEALDAELTPAQTEQNEAIRKVENANAFSQATGTGVPVLALPTADPNFPGGFEPIAPDDARYKSFIRETKGLGAGGPGTGAVTRENLLPEWNQQEHGGQGVPAAAPAAPLPTEVGAGIDPRPGGPNAPAVAPQAPADQGAPVLTPEQVRTAPPGTRFRTTDGRTGTVPQR